MSSQEQKALEFINKVAKAAVKSADDLKSGVILCNAVNEIAFRLKGTRPITDISKFGVAFAHMENISKALDAIRRDLGIQDRDIFTTSNLYSKDNLPQVWHCILILQKQYESAPPRQGETGITGGAAVSAPPTPTAAAPAAPSRFAPAPTAPTRSAPAAPAPARGAPVAPPTPRVSVVAPLTPRADEDKKLSNALDQLDTQRQRWQKEREEMEAKLAEQQRLLSQSQQREADKQKLLNEKGDLEYKLQQQYAQQLSEVQADLTNKLAQKTLEIEKIRSSRDLELQNAQLSSSKQVEQLTLKLSEYEQLSSANSTNSANNQKELEDKYQKEMVAIRTQLTKEKEEALLQSKLQQDRERMESEQRAIEQFRAQSEQQIASLQERAKQDLERELSTVKAQYEEELLARGGRAAQEQENASRQRSASLALTIEQEVAQRQAQIEETLRKKFESDVASMQQIIEVRMKSEEASFKQKEQQLQAELQNANTKLTQEKDQYQAKIATLETQGDKSMVDRAEIEALKKSLQDKENELRVNAALQNERDAFKAQQEEITKAKATMEKQFQADLQNLEQRLQAETTKLEELQFMLELKTKENEQLQTQQKSSVSDDAELKQIKADMEKEMSRLSTQMQENEKKFQQEQQAESKKNAQIQNDLERLQKQLEEERQSKLALQKQVQASEQQIKSLESVKNVPEVVGKSEREGVLEAELVSVKAQHQKEVDALNREIESLKKQLAAAKAATPAADAAPIARPVNPMAAAIRQNVAETPATDAAPVMNRPPNPMAAAFKAGGGASLALNSSADGAAAAPPRPPAGGLLAGIQGGIKLKKTTPGQGVDNKPSGGSAAPASAKPPGPISLVDQLKGGIQLKPRTNVAPPPPKVEDNTSMASVAAAMARDRAARAAAGQTKLVDRPPAVQSPPMPKK